MLQGLDDFSKKAAAQIFDKFPEWQQFSKIETYDDETALVVSVPSAGGGSDHPLTIDTFRSEITIGFYSYHAHFLEFESPETLSFIEKLLSSGSAVVSFWRDSEWCGSEILAISDLPKTNENYPYANTIKIRSWSGKLNADIPCASRD